MIGLLYEGVAENRTVDPNAAETVIRFSHIDPEVEDVFVAFIPYDQVYYTVSVAGGESEFLIGRYQLDLMMEAIADHISED